MMTKQKLDEVINYDPETGDFRWKVKRSGRKVVGGAGGVNGRGYRKICIDGKCYYAHRLAWLTTTGAFPPDDIDHIDGNPGNNSISNLRAVTHQENQRNLKRSSTNASGTTGVTLFKPTGKWAANITTGGRKKHLGYFADLADAVSVRKAAELEHGFHKNHGKR